MLGNLGDHRKRRDLRINNGSMRSMAVSLRYTKPEAYTVLILASLLFFFALSPQLYGLEIPPLKGRVNDYAGILSASETTRLEAKLTRFEQSDSTQVVVLTIPSLEGENLETYSIRVAETWKIGWKGLDNGVILLVSKAERKIRIEVGRGLEGKLTDLISGRIIRTIIIPHFKNGDFDGGVEAGTTAIIDAVRGEFKSKDPAAPSGVSRGKSAGSSMFTLAIFLVIILLFTSAASKIVGALVGTVGFPVIGSLAFGSLSLPILAILACAGLLMGLFFGFLAGYHTGGGWRGGGPFMGGGWGGSSGDSDSGGGSDFGGGGGDFGGGGASGDW